jgi:hypothetical protein
MSRKKLVPEYGFTLGNDADVKGGIIAQILDNIDDNQKELYSKMLSSFATSKGLSLQDVAKNFVRKTADDSVLGKLTFAQEIKSDNYAEGVLGQGWKMYKNDFGEGVLDIDKINVRKELITNLLTYEKVNAIGGTLLLSAASCVVAKTLLTSNGGIPVVRTYFKPDGVQINPWFVNDNIWVKSGLDKFLMSYVIARSTTLDSDGFYYIDIYYNTSSFDATKQRGVYLPNIGDVIVQHGYRGSGNDYRKNIILISIGGSTDEYPYIEQYKGVTGFDREGKLITRISDDVYFGDADKSKYIWWNKDGLGDFLLCGTLTQTFPEDDGFPTPSFKGAWVNTTEYYRGDVVTYEGSSWIMYDTTTSTGNAPYDGSPKWKIYAAKGDTGDTGDTGTDGKAMSLTAESFIFEILKNGTVSPSSIKITASGQNLSGLPAFSIDAGTATLTADTNYSKVLQYSNLTTKSVRIKCVWDIITDYITIHKVAEGEDSYTVVMSNENHTFTSDENGDVNSYLGSGTILSVYKGNEKLTGMSGTPFPADGEFSVGRNVITGSVVLGALSFSNDDIICADSSNMTTDEATVQYDIYIGGTSVVIPRTQSLSKSKQGYVGKAIRYTNWKVDVDYYDGELTGGLGANADKLLDYVTYKGSDGIVKAYKCTTAHTSSLSNSPTSAGSPPWSLINYQAVIASDLVLANQAVIGGFAFSEAITSSGEAIPASAQYMRTTDYTSDTPALMLKGDGSAQFAKGKVTFDANGKAYYEGDLTTNTANIGNFNIAYGKILSTGLEISDTAIESIATLQTDTAVTELSRPSPDTWTDSETGTTNNAHAYTQAFTASASGIIKFVCTIEPDIDADDYGWLVIVKDSNDNITFVQSARGLALSGKTFEVPVVLGVTYTIHAYSTGSFEIGNTYTTTASISGEFGNTNNIVLYNQVPKTKIGNNGIYSFFDDDKYLYFNAAYGFEVRFGNYGIRITTSGAVKTSDGFVNTSAL